MFALSLSNILTALAVLGSARASCLHGTTFMPRNQDSVPIATFNYDGETGPLHWASLSPNNDACYSGNTQSPIVLTPDTPYAAHKPTLHWPNVRSAEFENLGNTLEVVVEGTLEFGNKTYTLKQFHFHTPSEHRFHSEYYPLEAHFVHQAADQSLIVVGVPFELTEDSSTTHLLTNVIKHLDDVSNPGTKTETGALDFSHIIQAVNHGQLFHYTGSLTTPPCKEGVQFLILESPLAVNVKTWKALKKVMKFNARYTQNTPGKDNLLELATQYGIESGDYSPQVDVGTLVASL